MTTPVKVRRIGSSLGFILPKAVAETMGLQEGDDLFISVTPDSMSVTPYDPAFDAALKDAREFMRSHRHAFKELSR